MTLLKKETKKADLQAVANPKREKKENIPKAEKQKQAKPKNILYPKELQQIIRF